MNDSTPPEQSNPYVYPKDEALETFARGVIDEAIAKCAASPRNFSSFSALAAKRIAEYVLDHFERRPYSK
jgi:hypothetical protein